ncbi:MAG: hypothetical protein ACYTEQ_21825 [Planctomycetota bacterium]|jgi:hypothetical protein
MTQEFDAKQKEAFDDSIGKLIDGRVKAFSSYNRSRNVEWNINIAYLTGHQRVGLSGGHLVPLPKGDFDVTANKLLPAVQNDIAQVTKVPPKFDVVPDGTDDADRSTAIAGDKMAGYLRRINTFDMHRGRIMAWVDIAGLGWRKNIWKANHKVIGYNPEPEEEGNNPNLEAGQPIYQGEALSYHVPNNEVIFDWREDIDNLPWVIHARPMTLAALKQRYGDEVMTKIKEEDFYKPDAKTPSR